MKNHVEKELNYRLKFEEALTRISKVFSGLQLTNVKKGTISALRKISKIINAENAIIFLRRDNEESADKIVYVLNPDKKTDKIISLLRKKNCCPSKRVVRQELKAKSLICFPLVFQKQIKGFVIFASWRREIYVDKHDISLLKIFSEIIVNTLERLNAVQLVAKGVVDLEQSLTETIRTLGLAIEKHDPYTAGHQSRVAKLAVVIAKELGLPSDTISNINIGALIHDIGKIYIPSEILSRPGELTKAEREIIRSHPQAGYDIVKDAGLKSCIKNIVLSHHERLNGSGYPHKLKASKIPCEVRIVSVADVVEAMCTHRPYRPAPGIKAALLEIKSNSGKLYDPLVVDVCIKLFKSKKFKFAKNESGKVLDSYVKSLAI